ncbi:MAG TPA: hypothetical protein VH478_04250 [Trebonia sp.]|nr:hypothetical protein [Trebonia sp.]
MTGRLLAALGVAAYVALLVLASLPYAPRALWTAGIAPLWYSGRHGARRPAADEFAALVDDPAGDDADAVTAWFAAVAADDPAPGAAPAQALAPVPAPPPRAAQEAVAATSPAATAPLPRPGPPASGPGQRPSWGTLHGVRYGTFRHDGITGYPRTDALVAVDDATAAVTVIPATELSRAPEPPPVPAERELIRPWLALGPGGHCVAVSPAEFIARHQGLVTA